MSSDRQRCLNLLERIANEVLSVDDVAFFSNIIKTSLDLDISIPAHDFLEWYVLGGFARNNLQRQYPVMTGQNVFVLRKIQITLDYYLIKQKYQDDYPSSDCWDELSALAAAGCIFAFVDLICGILIYIDQEKNIEKITEKYTTEQLIDFGNSFGYPGLALSGYLLGTIANLCVKTDKTLAFNYLIKAYECYFQAHLISNSKEAQPAIYDAYDCDLATAYEEDKVFSVLSERETVLTLSEQIKVVMKWHGKDSNLKPLPHAEQDDYCHPRLNLGEYNNEVAECIANLLCPSPVMTNDSQSNRLFSPKGDEQKTNENKMQNKGATKTSFNT